MQKIVIHILLFATLLPSISPWGTVMYYNVNKAYIARVLCENRDRPQLHCDGKCYLAKKLKSQQDKQDKETTEHVHNLPTIQLFCDHYPSFTFAQLAGSESEFCSFVYRLAVYSAPLSSRFPATRHHLLITS